MLEIDFKRLNRLMMIYRIAQTILLALLIYAALSFQNHFVIKERPDQFIKSILIAVFAQLIFIFPVYKLAWRDAGLELDGSVTPISEEQLAALRKKRLLGDLLKFCFIIFYLMFVVLLPSVDKASGARMILASTLFSFLLTCLMYFQCFNFCAKKRMRMY